MQDSADKRRFENEKQRIGKISLTPFAHVKKDML